MADDINKMTLEETFESIDEISNKLNDENISLEQSFEYYKKGMDMLKHAKDTIDEVEKKVILLNSKEEGEE